MFGTATRQAHLGEPEQAVQTDLLALGMSAIRITAATERLLKGYRLDDPDIEEIHKVRQSLLAAAETLEFGLSQGVKGQGTASLTSVGLALDALREQRNPNEEVSENQEEYPAIFRRLAKCLENLAADQEPSAAEKVQPFFRALASTVSSQAGSPGDNIITSSDFS